VEPLETEARMLGDDRDQRRPNERVRHERAEEETPHARARHALEDERRAHAHDPELRAL
jgi:hypothetical protein